MKHNALARLAVAAVFSLTALSALAGTTLIDLTLVPDADTNFTTTVSPNETFDELYHFTIPSVSATSWYVSAAISTSAGVNVLTSGLYQGTLLSLAGATPSALLAAGQNNGLASGPFSTQDPGTPILSNLSAGDYTLLVHGVALENGGVLAGTLTTVSAVPEPDSYALFLTGLGLLGMVARRRQQAKNKTIQTVTVTEIEGA